MQVLPELPPIIEQEVALDLSDPQREQYNNAASSFNPDAAVSPTESSTTHLFALITKLKQICNYDDLSGSSSKFDALVPVLQDTYSNRRKLIIFSQYVRTLEWIESRIRQFGLPPMLYDGRLDERQREAIVTRFNASPSPEVLLVSLRAGGVGLNLDAADTVVLFDRWWNPAVEQQAIHRAHRFGRDRPLHVLKYLVTDTVESRIAEIIERKVSLFSEYIDKADDADIGRFSRQELMEVLGLL